MSISLAIRNIVFFILQPGIVVGLIPYLMIRDNGGGLLQDLTPGRIGAAGLFLVGLWLLISCIIHFGREGKGTLSPLDPTQELVVSGPYRYSRNPMYVGVMAMLIAEAIYFREQVLWWYAAGFFIAFNLFIVLHEEPRLRKAFGNAYDEYCKSVRRWI